MKRTLSESSCDSSLGNWNNHQSVCGCLSSDAMSDADSIESNKSIASLSSSLDLEISKSDFKRFCLSHLSTEYENQDNYIDSTELFSCRSPSIESEQADDLQDPSAVPIRVAFIVHTWSKTIPIEPHKYLVNLLKSRGYEYDTTPALSSSYRIAPTSQQLSDYENDIVWAIRNSDLDTIKKLRHSGKSLSACNRFSESIVHTACRRSEFAVVEYILRNGASYGIVDDYGRTPLHDVCWRQEPRFDVVTLLLEKDLKLLRLADLRGALPLDYVREDHWLQWCAFIYHQKDRYWPVLDAEVMSSREFDMNNYSSIDIQTSFQSQDCTGPLYWEPSSAVLEQASQLADLNAKLPLRGGCD